MLYDQVWFHWGEFSGKGNSQCKRHEERASFQADGWSWSRVSQGRMEVGGWRTAMVRFSIALWIISRFWIWFVWQEVIRGFWKEGAYVWDSLVAQTVKNLPAIQEIQVQSLGWGDTLEKGMATRSSTLAWKIPWTEEPGRLESKGSDKAMVFPVVMYGCESWAIKKTESQRTDAFELWFWRRLLRVFLTARRLNQSILQEISPEYSLEGLMLKLKLQHFGHMMQDSWMAFLSQWARVEQALGDGKGWRSLVCCSPRSQREGHNNESINRWLEKGVATHSRILAWRISWTEKPVQSMGSQSWTRLSD